jgi:hypothetical protein
MVYKYACTKVIQVISGFLSLPSEYICSFDMPGVVISLWSPIEKEILQIHYVLLFEEKPPQV